jgi:hypothetical protein
MLDLSWTCGAIIVLVDRLTSTWKNRLDSGSVQFHLTPPSGRFACGFGEDLCKMALVGESALER